MPAKSNPADKAVEYFQTAPLAEATQTLEIIKGIVKRRLPVVVRRRKSPAQESGTGGFGTTAS
jgi:hypothetical protein